MANIDLEGFRETFDSNFAAFDPEQSIYYGGTSGIWETHYDFGLYGGDRTLYGNNEEEWYVDPHYAGTATASLGLDPFSVNNGTLTITATPTPSQDLQYVNNFP